MYMCNSWLLLKESHGGLVCQTLVRGWGELVGALSIAECVCGDVGGGV